MVRSRAAVLLVTVIVSAFSMSCSYGRTPGQTVETATRYDSASRQLTIGCATASTGACHLLVDNRGEQRALTLKAGASSTIDDIDPAARTCAAASAVAPAECNWVPVHQAADS